MRYVIDVDEVVLEGLPAVDRRRLSQALSDEFVLLVGRHGLATDSSDRDLVHARDIELIRPDARTIGRDLARSVHGALRK